jgi:hypothetical protein
MTATDLAQDGTVIWTTLAEPGRGLAQAVTRRRATTALLVGTLAALLSTAILIPHLDMEKAAADQLQPDMTPHERAEALATATKLEHVKQWSGALIEPTLLATLLAAALFLAFRVAGTKPGFRETITVSSHALLPIWLRGLLAVPAAVAHAPVAPADVARLLPSSLGALLPTSLPPPALAAASAMDLFALWAAYLVGTGMARASGASRRRAFVVTAILFVAYVCLFKVIPSAASAGGPGGPRGGP